MASTNYSVSRSTLESVIFKSIYHQMDKQVRVIEDKYQKKTALLGKTLSRIQTLLSSKSTHHHKDLLRTVTSISQLNHNCHLIKSSPLQKNNQDINAFLDKMKQDQENIIYQLNV